MQFARSRAFGAPHRGDFPDRVPNQVCSQCRTNWIEPPVTDSTHMMDRTNSTSDGKRCTDPDARAGAAVSHTVPDHGVGIALDGGDTLAADTQTLQTPHFLLTGVRCEEGFCDISMPMPQEDGFTVVIQFPELPEHELWIQIGACRTQSGWSSTRFRNWAVRGKHFAGSTSTILIYR
jgi:hypothetical protein